MRRIDEAMFILDHFCRIVFWYLRQRKVRRLLFTHPVFVFLDLARRSVRLGRRDYEWQTGTIWERLARIEAELVRWDSCFVV